MAEDRVAAAVAELYGADPAAFTERRKALAAAAREAGDRGAASAITALRKPTRAAWLVNRLARADPDAPARLAALAAELRAAERAKDGPRLRELSAARGALLDALTAQALAAAGTPDPPPSLRAEVTDTLTAALADPEAAERFAAGALTKAAHWSGFGYADVGAAGSDASPSAAPRTATPRTAAPRTAAPTGRAASTAPNGPTTAQRAAQERRRVAAEVVEEERQQQGRQRQAAEERRRAQEAAERTARAKEKFDAAERTLAQASAAAAEAAAVEDGLEAEVRRLEERLTEARDELASARLRARRAEAAERRARQAVEQLPRP